MVTVLVLLAAIYSLPAPAADFACLDPILEVRAVWIDAAAMPKNEYAIRKMVNAYARAGVNVLFPETICRGYAVYPSELVARDPRFVGAPDTLAILIREAHRLGIEIHPWVWVFRAGYSQDRGAILKAHPDWAERDSDGNELSRNGGYWLSPANPAAREFLVNLFRELVTKYDVDGLHLDYIRYESQAVGDFGYNDFSVAEFIRQHGFDPRPGSVKPPVENQTGNEAFNTNRFLEPPVGPLRESELNLLDKWRRFREDQISSFVERVAYEMRYLNPGAPNPPRRPLIISAAVGEMPDTARLVLFQNWINWLDNKWLDFVVPMSYTTDDARFLRLVRLQREAVGCRSLLVPGIGVHLHKELGQTVCQVLLAREARADGVSLFSASYLKPDLIVALEDLFCASGEPDAVEKSDQPQDRCLLPFREPLAGAQLLWNRAAELYTAGMIEEGDHFLARGNALASYAAYHALPTPYLPPMPKQQ
ncbi:MAG: family 10 glycosylhydrolase [Armatimonadetes bacterium]|nr:family 10 glycosylhydrolase [Armatimonadota bacterium]